MPSKDHPRIAEAITDDIRTAFGDALQAVLLYGSARTGKTYWDLDMLVVLAQKDNPVRDLERLRAIRNDYTEQTLDLQLFY
jgi:predicted nucleotidyltransferase